MPSPQRIAPFSYALEADLDVGDESIADARLIVLYNPDGDESWEGCFRCVGLIRADVDVEMVTDPLLAEVAWSWLTDALTNCDASYCHLNGTVTSQSSRCFGLLDKDDTAEIEIRASWTPEIRQCDQITSHLRAWEGLTFITAGQPFPDDQIVPLTTRRLNS